MEKDGLFWGDDIYLHVSLSRLDFQCSYNDRPGLMDSDLPHLDPRVPSPWNQLAQPDYTPQLQITHCGVRTLFSSSWPDNIQ